MSKQVFTVESTVLTNRLPIKQLLELLLGCFCFSFAGACIHIGATEPALIPVGATKVQTWQHSLFEWGLHVLALSKADFLRL